MFVSSSVKIGDRINVLDLETTAIVESVVGTVGRNGITVAMRLRFFSDDIGEWRETWYSRFAAIGGMVF